MSDQVKLLIEQSVSQSGDAANVHGESPAGRRWLLDALEDDEVREVLGKSAAPDPCTTGQVLGKRVGREGPRPATLARDPIAAKV